MIARESAQAVAHEIAIDVLGRGREALRGQRLGHHPAGDRLGVDEDAVAVEDDTNLGLARAGRREVALKVKGVRASGRARAGGQPLLGLGDVRQVSGRHPPQAHELLDPLEPLAPAAHHREVVARSRRSPRAPPSTPRRTCSRSACRPHIYGARSRCPRRSGAARRSPGEASASAFTGSSRAMKSATRGESTGATRRPILSCAR